MFRHDDYVFKLVQKTSNVPELQILAHLPTDFLSGIMIPPSSSVETGLFNWRPPGRMHRRHCFQVAQKSVTSFSFFISYLLLCG